jgi:hypothetical protein
MARVQLCRARVPAFARAAKILSLSLLVAAFIGTTASRPASADDIPTFAVDPSWPKPLPNNWILGQVGGITVDWQGHFWAIRRPRSLTDDEKGATLNPPRSKCCVPAPPVLEFDVDGNLLRAWGGPGDGYEWVGRSPPTARTTKSASSGATTVSWSAASAAVVAMRACFNWVHAMADDKLGNVYTAEVDNGKSIQKFRLTSDALH